MPYQFLTHTGYAELRLFGVLGPLEPLAPEERGAIDTVKAVLYNYNDVEEIDYDPRVMSAAIRRMADRGVKLAALAEKPAWFGVNRQLIQWSGLDETKVRVFKERAPAVQWLLYGDAPAG